METKIGGISNVNRSNVMWCGQTTQCGIVHLPGHRNSQDPSGQGHVSEMFYFFSPTKLLERYLKRRLHTK